MKNKTEQLLPENTAGFLDWASGLLFVNIEKEELYKTPEVGSLLEKKNSKQLLMKHFIIYRL